MSLSSLIEEIARKARVEDFGLTRAEFKELLEPAFYASLEKDESRESRFSIQLYNDEHLADNEISSDSDFSFFPTDEPYTSRLIKKICHSINYARSRIIVKKVGNGFKVAGLYSLGSRLENYLQFAHIGTMAPPEALTISFNRPGCFSIQQGLNLILRFEGGQILEQRAPHALELFQGTYFPHIFSHEIGLGAENGEITDEYRLRLNEFFCDFFTSLVINTMRQGHGGTIVLLSDLSNIEKRVRRGIQIDRKSAAGLFCEALTKEKSELINRRVFDYSKFLASLTGYDGAVVLSMGFDLLSFGAEIITGSEDLNNCPIDFDYYAHWNSPQICFLPRNPGAGFNHNCSVAGWR